MSPKATSRAIRKNHRDYRRFMQRALTHLLVVYRIWQELCLEMGTKGARHWLRANCPELHWDELQALFEKARDARVPDLARRIALN